jgi:4-hydroxybenzoate polyprenyltransferase
MQNHVRDPSVSRPASGAGGTVPLCVDLDGTLLKSDMLMETLAGVLRRHPLLALAVPFWLLRGRAALKSELARRAEIDVTHLPYDRELLKELQRQRSEGRRIYLATASDELVARKIADHLGIFDGVIASDGRNNVKGEAKARVLVERFGEKGFDYAGEDRHDVPVWKRAREPLVVKRESRPLRALLRGIRAYQWAKNVLVFVPLATAHRLDMESFVLALLAFAAFSLVASSVYLVNDLVDLQDDRRHPVKRERPIAAGDLGIDTAILLVPVLLAGAVAITLLLPWEFGLLLGVYVAVNVAYSLALKRVALLDVFILAALYTLRILAGAAAISVPVSHWLLAFSLFAFLSLALIKRFVEVSNVAARDETRVGGRGYLAGDGALLAMLGTASGYLSVLVFALYITSPQVVTLYRRPELLWFAVPLLLYWMSRIWFLAHRGQVTEDPLLFSLGDPASHVTGALIVLAMMAAT